jgi:hypothetical protein
MISQSGLQQCLAAYAAPADAVLVAKTYLSHIFSNLDRIVRFFTEDAIIFIFSTIYIIPVMLTFLSIH